MHGVVIYVHNASLDHILWHLNVNLVNSRFYTAVALPLLGMCRKNREVSIFKASNRTLGAVTVDWGLPFVMVMRGLVGVSGWRSSQ